MSKIKFTIAGLALTVISISSAANAQQTTGQPSVSGQTQSGTQAPGTQTPGQQNPGQPGAGQAGRPAPPVQTQRDQQALNQQGPNSGSQSDNQQSVSVEEALAKKIKKSNDAEIELAQLAQDKVDDQSFRQFTQMLIQDHQQMNQQLEKFVSTTGGRSSQDATTRGSATQGSTDRAPAGQGAASGNGAGQNSAGQNSASQNASGQNAAGQAGRNTAGQAGQDSQPQSGTTSRLSDGQGQAAGMAGGRVPQMLCTIMDEACDNNLEMTKQMLQEHEGQDFKMAFIGHQIVAHTACLAEMKAIQSSGPAQLKQLAQQAMPKIQEHLDMAKKMAKKFEDDRTSGEGSSKSKSDDSK